MRLQYSDFKENDAWVIFRLDTQIKAQPIDIYLVADLPSGVILAFGSDPSGGITATGVSNLLKEAKGKKGLWPRRILLGKGDPAEDFFVDATKVYDLALEVVPIPYLEDLVAPVKESFGGHCYSPSSIPYVGLEDWASEDERESAKSFIPDSYDPCSCGSDKKFKFCCKPILRETMGAMSAAERGLKAEALDWIAKAKAIVGETAEVLCREAIVYSFFDRKKMSKVLERCLKINPKHPRANYISGIECKEVGDFKGAIKAYECAIENYPKTDRYHLNETLNNLGTAYFELGDFKAAKASWEQGLVLLPSDQLVRKNLVEFIYSNPSVPIELRRPSAFVEKFLKRKSG